jgi:DnaJ-class molecular chaperone
MAIIHSHYDNLKVARNAPPEVIRAAYKALSQKWHPDRNGDAEAHKYMAIINAAYAVLSDPVKRKEHDDWLSAQELEVRQERTPRQSLRKQQRQQRRESERLILMMLHSRQRSASRSDAVAGV